MSHETGPLISRMLGIGALAVTVGVLGCSPSPPPLKPAPSPQKPGGVREAIIQRLEEAFAEQHPKKSISKSTRKLIRTGLRILTTMRQGDAVWVVFDIFVPAERGFPGNEHTYGIALVSLQADQQVIDLKTSPEPE